MTPDRQFSLRRLADLYDLGNAGSEDRDYYLSLARNAPQDILDLGCGTGLLSLAFANQGHRVVGVDPARAMLAVAKRATNAQSVTWVESSAEKFRSERNFDLIIMTGHAFQVLLGDDQVRAAFQSITRHMMPNGRAVFESRNPALDWDAVWAREYTMETRDGTVRAVRRIKAKSRAPEYLSFAWDYHFHSDTVTSDSTLRFMSKSKIIEMAELAGLRLTALHGGWDGTDFDPNASREMIFQFRLDQPSQK